jgi:hypothetical protein
VPLRPTTCLLLVNPIWVGTCSRPPADGDTVATTSEANAKRSLKALTLRLVSVAVCISLFLVFIMRLS